VPANIISLLQPEVTKPRVSSARTAPAVPVPYSAVPKFAKPNILVEDNFWSNLKQFFFERPIKVRERKDAPFTQTSFGTGLADNLKDFFSSRPTPKGPVNSKLAVAWGSNFGSFGTRVREFFSPPKQAALPPGIKPIKVREIWSKDENFGTSQILAIGLHIAAIGLLVVPIFTHVLPTSTEAMNKQVNVTPLDISPYVAKLPAGNDKAGGGGGGNNHTLTPTSKGKVPKFQWTQFGDPLAKSVTDSLGNGNGTGIGSGSGGGLGPGEGGGTGGGVFRAGVNGVGTPSCFYQPSPEYSEEARKTKYQGAVVVEGVINLDGRVTDIRVVKGVGMGLDENAVAAVKTWRCKPASGPSGKPVRTLVPIEVTFRLY
jgi:protein TonB